MRSRLENLRSLAFVDIETTGLGADHQRIADIGVVVDDAGAITEWGTPLDPGRRIADLPHEIGGERPYFCNDRAGDVPRFGDIAADLARRLDGRLLVAHNARFDYAFLKAEFERAGIAFAPAVVCSMMLSRALFPDQPVHDLDTVCARHDIAVGERHRALPDARLLARAWSAMEAAAGAGRFAAAVASLLEEPLLPPQLDVARIDALPERPGVFAFVDADERALLIGRAGNLRRHARAYFRLDRHCARADAIAGRLARIRWEATSGPLDARLRELRLRRELRVDGRAQRCGALPWTIRLDPAAVPATTIVEASDDERDEADRFGLFATARKATNALARIAARERMCPRFAGLDVRDCACSELQHTRQLIGLARALSPLKLQRWPFAGPIAVRERQTLHVFDRWEHLASVRTVSDVQRALAQRRNGFDPDVYALLARRLPRIRGNALRVIALNAGLDRSADSRNPVLPHERADGDGAREAA